MFVPKVLLIYPALRSFVIVLLFRWRESLLVRPALRVMDFILGFLLVTWVIISWAPHALTHNFLVMLPFSSLSHKHVLDSIAEELVNSGHQVSWLSRYRFLV